MVWGDLFAGFGGTSLGMQKALGREPDFAINHWPLAIRVHERNHPDTVHFTENLWRARPSDVARKGEVGGLWFSPDCTHHSNARGSKPRRQDIRALANIIPHWLRDLEPTLFFIENVREFEKWGPLGKDRQPDPEREGEHFDRLIRQCQRLGYDVDWQVLDCSRYGAPTRRNRLFIVGSNDGIPPLFPEPTHGPGLLPFHTAAECIDFDIPAGSIFPCTCAHPHRSSILPTHCEVCGGRLRPLVEKTMWRIAQGLRRFLYEDPDPFVISIDQQSTGRTDRPASSPLSTITTVNRHGIVTPVLIKANHGGKGRREARVESIQAPFSTITAGRRGHSMVVPQLIQVGYGERKGQRARVLNLRDPLGTVVAQGRKHALVTAFLTKYFGADREGGFNGGSSLRAPIGTVTSRDHHGLVTGNPVKLRGQCHGAGLRDPFPTITAKGMHVGEVRAFLTAYYGDDKAPGRGQDLREPMRTLTAKARLGLVTVHGVDYQLVDVCFRMLTAPELLRGTMGELAEGFDLSDAETQEDQIAGIGNMVPPAMVDALISANLNPRKRLRRAA